MLEMLADCDPRFKLGLSVFLEGVQGLSGNHRLLIDAQDALEHLSCIERIVGGLDKRWGFCIRSEKAFILVFSP